MKNCMNNREIPIREVIKYVIRKWRLILLFTILTCCVGVFLSAIFHNTIDKVEYSEEEKSLLIEEMECLDLDIEMLTNEKQQFEKMLGDWSILFANPLDINVYSISYITILNDDINKGQQIATLFEEYLNSKKQQLCNSHTVLIINQTENLFTIDIYYDNDYEVDMDKIVVSIKNMVSQCNTQLKNMLGDYELVMTMESDYTSDGLQIIDIYNIYCNNLEEINTVLNEKIDEKQKIENYLGISQEIGLREITKYAIYGVFGFVFIVCCVSLYYLFSDKILCESELKDLFKLYSVGLIYTKNDSFFNNIDKKILGIKENKIDQIEYVNDNLKCICKEGNINSVAVINVCKIKKNKEFEKYDFIKSDKTVFYYDKKSMLHVIETHKNVVLQIYLESTTVTMIENVISECEKHNVNIIGAICYY